MADDDTRERMATTLRRIGHQPRVRGGNGRGPTEPQRRLAEALGWEIEYVVPVGRPRREGWPTHYRLDIADPVAMVCVEVDGPSHSGRPRQESDARKDAFLKERGWLVLRFSNQAATDDLQGCVQTVRSTTSKSRGRTPTSQTG